MMSLVFSVLLWKNTSTAVGWYNHSQTLASKYQKSALNMSTTTNATEEDPIIAAEITRFMRGRMLLEHHTEGEGGGGEEEEVNALTLTKLLLAGMRTASVNAEPQPSPTEFMNVLKLKGTRQVCQYQFKKNDIVWICRECQKDETCVLCNDCYMRSNHEGHDVYFYHSQAGGCCDCGDFGAWCSDGFCDRHGHVHVADPLATVDPVLLTCGLRLLSSLMQELSMFAEDYEKSYDLNVLQRLHEQQEEQEENGEQNDDNDANDDFAVVLHKDDVNTENIITTLLTTSGISRNETSRLYSEVMSQGTSLLPFPRAQRSKPMSAIVLKTLAEMLRLSGLKVSAASSALLLREKRVCLAIAWLTQLAHTNDGQCRMICISLAVPLLVRIIRVDPYLPRTVSVPLHNLFLTLMSDQSFKLSLAIAYAQGYRSFSQAYAQGFGTSDNSIFTLSVQFLNRELFVSEIVRDHNFFFEIMSAIESMLFMAYEDAMTASREENRDAMGRDKYAQRTAALLKHSILVHRRYNPLFGDLKVIFAIPGMSRVFLAATMPCWLRILSRFQQVHMQIRELHQHVAFENDTWMAAFNLYLGIGILFEFLNNWLDMPTAHQDVPPTLISSADQPIHGQQQQQQLMDLAVDEQCEGTTTPQVPPMTNDDDDDEDDSEDIDMGNSNGEPSSWSSSSSSSSSSGRRDGFFASWAMSERHRWTWNTSMLPSALSVATATLDAVLDWQKWYRSHCEKPSLEAISVRKRPLSFTIFSSSNIVVSLPPLLIDGNDYSNGGGSSRGHGLSFHLFLHRYLSSLITDCCKYPQHAIVLQQFQGRLLGLDSNDSTATPPSNRLSVCHLSNDAVSEMDEPQVVSLKSPSFNSSNKERRQELTLLMDLPLRAALFAAQIRIQMWRRNGAVMGDQLMNYVDLPYAKVYRDLDMHLIQMCGTAYTAKSLVMHVFHRFGVLQYLRTRCLDVGYNDMTDNDDEEDEEEDDGDVERNCSNWGTVRKSDEQYLPALTDEALLLLINLATELPLPADPVPVNRALEIVKRELIHHLAGGPATFSQLLECANSTSSHDLSKIGQSELERVVLEVTDIRQVSPLEPPQYHLKKVFWSLYDPTFPHTSMRVHQKASELRPNATTSFGVPIAPMPPPAHSCVEPFRLQLLLEPVLLRTLRDLLLIAASMKSKSGLYEPVRQQWTIKCEGAEFTRVIHLLTLATHLSLSTLQSSSSSSQKSEMGVDSNDVSDEKSPVELANDFASFLLEEITLSSQVPISLDDDPVLRTIQLPHLLQVLCDLQAVHDPLHEAQQKSWLSWLVNSSTQLSPKCAAYVKAQMQSKSEENRAQEMEEKKRRARERAMKAMQASSAKFAAHLEKLEEAEAQDLQKAAAGDGLTAGDGANSDDTLDKPVCIVCQCQSIATAHSGHAANDRLGFLGYSQLSRVRGGNQHALRSPITDPDGHKPIVAGDIWLANDKHEVEHEKLLREHDVHTGDLHVSFCGHAMHYSCFDSYFASVLHRSENQNHMMLDPHRGMLDCPMCKRLSNVLVPISMWASTNSSMGLAPTSSVSTMAVSSSEGKDMSGIVLDTSSDHDPMMMTSIGGVEAVDLGKRKRTSSASLDAAVDHQFPSCNSLHVPTTALNNDHDMWTRWIQRPILFHQAVDVLVSSSDVAMVESSDKFEDAHEGMDGIHDGDDDDDDDGDSDDERPAMVDFADAVDDLYDNEEEDEDENEDVTWYETGDNDDDDSLAGFFEVAGEEEEEGYEHMHVEGYTRRQRSPRGGSPLRTKLSSLIPAHLIAHSPLLSGCTDIVRQDRSFWHRFLTTLCDSRLGTVKALSSSSVGEWERSFARRRSTLVPQWLAAIDDHEAAKAVAMSSSSSSSSAAAAGAHGKQDHEGLCSDSDLVRAMERSMLFGEEQIVCLEVALAAMAYTFSIDEVERSTHGSSGGTRGFAHSNLLVNVVDGIGISLRSFCGLDRAIELLNQSFRGNEPFQSIPFFDAGASDIAEGSVKLSHWLVEDALPLLLRPHLDCLILLLAATSPDVTSEENGIVGRRVLVSGAFEASVRWLCVAQLAQIMLAEVADVVATDSSLNDTTDAESFWASSGTDVTVDAVARLWQSMLCTFQRMDNAERLLNPQTVCRLLRRWIAFLRVTVHTLKVCRRTSILTDTDNGDGGNEVDLETMSNDAGAICAHVMELLNVLDFGDLMALPQSDLIALMEQSVLKWVSHTVSYSSNCNLSGFSSSSSSADLSTVRDRLLALVGRGDTGYRYPFVERPRLLSLPASYTQLHSRMSAMSNGTYAHPALCVLCGAVMEAGTGACSRHIRRCCKDSGVIFLLQDCTILLSVGGYCSYFFSIYVDDYGERHRHYRGKPLHLDERRYNELRKLWASHGVGNEVIQKRSTSQRVIITGYY